MLHWYQWVFLCLGVDVFGALCFSIYERANDIYNNKRSDFPKYWQNLLWPIGIVVYAPKYMVEFPAQFVAKYKEYKRNKKLHINKVA